VFRAIFLAFFGEYRGDAHPHESPAVMTLPLVALAALSLGGGFLPVPRWLAPMFPPAEHHNQSLVVISVAAGLAGIFLAWLFYVARPGLADALAGRLGWVYRTVLNKYYVDEIYGAVVVDPVVDGSRSVLWEGIDVEVIDAGVNGIGARARGLGSILRRLQSGYIRSYAAWVLLGAVSVLVALGLAGEVK
jgi:NADH-quinone oxidoreductase subunit L